VIDILGDEARERRAVGERSAAKYAGQQLRLQQLPRGVLREHLAQAVVVPRSQESESRNDGARAYPGNDLKLGARAGFRPADEQTRAECSVCTATRQRQEVDDRASVLALVSDSDRLHVRQAGAHVSELAGAGLVSPEAGGLQTAHLRLLHQSERHGVACGGRDASPNRREHHERHEPKHETCDLARRTACASQQPKKPRIGNCRQ
jgi:hypothetical protein